MSKNKHNLYKKINLKKIEFNIIFLISLLFSRQIYSQFTVSNPENYPERGDLTSQQEEESGKIINRRIEEITEPYGIIACQAEPYINNPDCFNNLLIFDHKEYQVNNFATNKNGDFLIQYNENNNEEESISSRLFYGITKNGSYFFANKSSFSHEFNIDINEEILEDIDFLNLFGNQDSKNLFISLYNDKKNQYLFSINSYYSMVELYDFNDENNNNYHIWNFNKFFNLDEDDYFYPFEYELFEFKGKSEYIIAFRPLFIIGEEMLDVNFLKRFRFKSFDKEAYEELSSINYTEYLNSKIINIFLLEESNILGVLAINENIIEEDINEISMKRLSINERSTVSEVGGDISVSKRRADYGNKYYPSDIPFKFNLKFYSQKLKSLTGTREVLLFSEIIYECVYLSEELFIKSLNLNVLNKQYVLFLYYAFNNDDPTAYFIFDLFEINIKDYINRENVIYPINTFYLQRNNMDFDTKESLNDFIKINDNKVVFMYMAKSINNKLVILIIFYIFYN